MFLLKTLSSITSKPCGAHNIASDKVVIERERELE